MEFEAMNQSCPDFEDLSCYADGELSAGREPDMAKHVDACQRCAGLMAQLRQGFGSSAAAPDGASGSGCADEERLILYLMRDLEEGERAVVEQHLGHCDPCVYGLSLLHRRLRVQDFVDQPVPAQLQERVRTIIEVEGREHAAQGVARVPHVGWWERVRDTLDNVLRLPVLLPVAVAAGALLVVGVREADLVRSVAPSDIRAVDLARNLRVTAGRAEVRVQPRQSAAVVVTVDRGQLLRLAGEERDWYRVELPEGGAGWVAKEAFE